VNADKTEGHRIVNETLPTDQHRYAYLGSSTNKYGKKRHATNILSNISISAKIYSDFV
jgi:hypothetical protein